MSLLSKVKEEQKQIAKKINLIATLFAIFVVMFPIIFPVVTAKAAPNDALKSWVRGTTQYESENGYFTYKQDFGGGIKGGGEVSTTEATISNIILNLGWTFYQGFRGTGNGDINATTTGILMGNVVTGGTNWFTFDMHDDNLYGQIGATIYFVLRLVFLPFLFIFVLFMLIKTLWTAGGRQGLGEMKGVIYSGIISVVLVFLMPQIVDWLCEMRDAFEVVMLRTLQNFDIGNGVITTNMTQALGTIEDSYYAYAMNDGHVGSALVYLGVVLIPLSFMVSYIKIAIQQIMLFGLFPVFCGISIVNKPMLTNWLAVFISNIFVPVLDVALVMLPLCIMQSLSINAGNAPILSAIMIIVSMNAVIPARNAVLHLIGGGLGVAFAGGQGFSLLAAGASAGAAAARAAVNGVRGAFNGARDVPDKPSDNESRANDAALSESTKSLVDNEKKMDDVDGMRESDRGIADTNRENADAFRELHDVEGMQDEGKEGVTVGNDESNVVADAEFSEMPDNGDTDAEETQDVDAVVNATDTEDNPDGVDGEAANADLNEAGGEAEADADAEDEGVKTVDVEPAEGEGGADADSDEGVKTADIEHVEGEEVSPEEMASKTADMAGAAAMGAAAGAAAADDSDNNITNNLKRGDENNIAGLKGYEDKAVSRGIRGEVDKSADRIFGKDGAISGRNADAKADFKNLTSARADNQIQRDAYKAHNEHLDRSTAKAKANMAQNSSQIAANNAEIKRLQDEGRNDPEMAKLNNQIRANNSVIQQNDNEIRQLQNTRSQLDRDERNGAVGKEITDANGIKTTISMNDYRDRIDGQIAKLQEDNRARKNENSTLNNQVRQREADNSTTRVEREAAIKNYQQMNTDLNKQNNQERARIENNNAQKTANIENIKKCDERENQFARAFKEAGYSDRRYGSASEMYSSLKHDNRLAQSANYKNYNTKAMNGVLSEREHARYQQEARAKAQRQVAGRVIGGIAGATAAGVGSAFVATGASIGAGLVTGFGGEQVSNRAMMKTAEAVMKGGTTLGATVGSKIGGGVVTGVQDRKLKQAEDRMANGKTVRAKRAESDSATEKAIAVEGERFMSLRDKEAPKKNSQKRLPPPKTGPDKPNKPNNPNKPGGPVKPDGPNKPTKPTAPPSGTVKNPPAPRTAPNMPPATNNGKGPESPEVRRQRDDLRKLGESYEDGKRKAFNIVNNSDLSDGKK